MKKADILRPQDECDTRGPADCRKSGCPEYDTCDECGRRVCKYVAVTVYSYGVPDSLICRICAKGEGWADYEIASQAVDPELDLAGDNLHKWIAQK